MKARIHAAQQDTPNVSYHVRASYFEVYNEHVRDLLVPVVPGQAPYYLKIRESPIDGPYVKDLTEVMRLVAEAQGIATGRFEEHIGLWVNRESPRAYLGTDSGSDLVKLGAIGVRISRWVTMHGFAFNLTTDLSLFRLIVPCGISEFGVGSVASLTSATPSVESAAQLALPIFSQIFGYEAPELRAATISTLANGVPSEAPNTSQEKPLLVS